MIVTGWNNGKHHVSGAGYGLKIAVEDRDKHFDRTWHFIFVQIEDNNEEAEINIQKKSFWGKVCRELISQKIGIWLRWNKLAPWPKGNPPKLILLPVQENHFHLTKRIDSSIRQSTRR